MWRSGKRLRHRGIVYISTWGHKFHASNISVLQRVQSFRVHSLSTNDKANVMNEDPLIPASASTPQDAILVTQCAHKWQ